MKIRLLSSVKIPVWQAPVASKFLTRKQSIACAVALACWMGSAHADTLSFNFENGTMQGWTNKLSSTKAADYYDLQFAAVSSEQGWDAVTNNPGFGNFFLGENPGTNDNRFIVWTNWPATNSGVHQTIWAQSPSFILDGSGNLTYFGCGSEGAVNPATGVRNISLTNRTIPVVAGNWGAETSHPPGNEGTTAVGLLRDDGTFVLSRNFTNWGSTWLTYTFTAAELAPYVNDGHSYTLNVVDFLAGNGAWCAIDNVNVPGRLGRTGILPPPALQVSLNNDKTKLVLRGVPTLAGKTQTLISSEDVTRPTANWTVVQNVTTTDAATTMEVPLPSRTTYYRLKGQPVYAEYVSVSAGPTNATCFSGESTVLGVNATGSLLKYQWYKGGQLLLGQTESNLTLTNLTTADSGVYSVVVSGILGGPITNSTTVSVIDPEVQTVLDPVRFFNVTLTDPFWAPRIVTHRNVTLTNFYQNLIDNHNVNNFDQAAGLASGDRDGWAWSDGDVYALLQGLLRANKVSYSSTRDTQAQNIITKVLAAQTKAANLGYPGYCNTFIQMSMLDRLGTNNPHLTPWQDCIGAHEHVVAGGFIEAAMDDYLLAGNTRFMNGARAYANEMSSLFGPAPKRSAIGGHQGLESQLLKLSRIPGLGLQSDFDLAKFNIEERGRHSGGRPLYGEYCQDLHELINETEPYGHCVRAAYHWESAASMARTTQDTNLISRLETLWDKVVNRKMYVTGGIGHQLCNEGFSVDYDLSNEWSYNETCASCGMMFWGREMANLLGDGKYSDIIELELYNVLGAARSLDGKRCYYRNYIKRTTTTSRLGIDCCRANQIRTIPDIPSYQYATKSGDGIWTHLYMAGQASISYGGKNITIQQATQFPWDGSVTMTMTPGTATPFTLHLRIPGWATNVTLSVNGQNQSINGITKGYLPVSRTWQNGDVVQLNMPMPVRRIYSHSKVAANVGRVAIARGPIVYCLESPYNSGVDVHRLVIPSTATLTAGAYNSGDLGGIVRITGTGINADTGLAKSFTLIPYAVWDNANTADDSKMCVMIPETTGAVITPPDRGRLANATVLASYGNDKTAINDGILALNSYDQTIPRFTWWGTPLGSSQWIEYDFPQAMNVWRSDIFWFHEPQGDCRFPQSFFIQYWDGTQFKNVTLDADYASEADYWSDGHATTVRFTPVTTTKIRLNVQLQPGKSGGILEWRLPE